LLSGGVVVMILGSMPVGSCGVPVCQVTGR
jgi:hypothetical protein